MAILVSGSATMKDVARSMRGSQEAPTRVV